MSDILVGEGFGNLSDGTHAVGVSREILGSQWSGHDRNFTLTDRADGRKWLNQVGAALNVGLLSKTWAGLTEIFVAFRIKRDTALDATVVAFMDGAAILGYVGINSTGNVVYSTAVRGAPAAPVAASTGVIPTNTETHVEVRLIFHGATGSVKIWLNGVLDSDTTGIDTIDAGTSCTQTRWLWNEVEGFYPPGIAWLFGDMVVHEAADALGGLGAYYLPVDGDGVDTDFTPSAGVDNYAMCDEIGPDEDTTYNESDGTAGHRDSLENGGIAGMAIVSVGSLARARKTGANPGTLLVGVVHSGSESQGSAVTLSEDYLSLVEFFDDVPGGAGWSLAQLGAAEVSYEVGA